MGTITLPCAVIHALDMLLRKKVVLFLHLRFFRVVHAPVFLLSFASDRRHMKDAAGNWIAEPPSYEAIAAQGKL